MIHENSIAAYHDADRKATAERRRDEILACLRSCGPLTDREVRDTLHMGDMNDVRPRITELIDDGYAHDVGTKRDPMTKKSVRIVSAALV